MKNKNVYSNDGNTSGLTEEKQDFKKERRKGGGNKYRRRSENEKEDITPHNPMLLNRPIINVSPKFEWQTAISQSTHADDKHHPFGQLYATVHLFYFGELTESARLIVHD